MPEFTFDESDNAMAIASARELSDGDLVKEWFTVLRLLKKRDEGILNTNYSLWLSTIQSEMEVRGITKNGKIKYGGQNTLTAPQRKMLMKLNSGVAIIHHHKSFHSNDDWYSFCVGSFNDPEYKVNVRTLKNLIKKNYVCEDKAESSGLGKESFVHITDLGKKALEE